jgi:hypothetical protein
MTSFVIAFASLALVLGLYALVGLPFGARGRPGAGERILCAAHRRPVLRLLRHAGPAEIDPPGAAAQRRPGGASDRLVHDRRQRHLSVAAAAGRQRAPLLCAALEQKTAGALQKAIEDNAQSHGGGIVMQLPFERSWDKRDPVFHPLPQPKLPEKRGSQPPVTTYSAPEQRA